ncbi:MAG: hypothetical protein ABL933_02760 [Methyloglobulus sp.]|nr:hypothetical protein [Methyloglobulus sp.]
MSEFIIFILVGMLLLIAILLLFRNRGNTPSTVAKVEVANLPVHNTEAGILIRDYLRIAFSGENVTDDSEKVTIERMRQNLSIVLEELNFVYNSIALEAYDARWAIVYCATKLESPAVLAFLNDIVRSSIPPEESRNIHLYSTVAEENTIRMRALEGIRILAANENKDAQDSLVSFLQLSSLSLRIAASQALIHLPDGENNRTRIQEQLPTSEHYFIELRQARAEDFGVCNAPFGDLAPPFRRPNVSPVPPLAQDAKPSGKPTIPARPTPKVPPVIK